MHNESHPGAPLRMLVTGAGFAGLGLVIRLRQAGIGGCLVLEKAADVGGCWRENRYPSAACNVPPHLYSFSFKPKADWSRKFTPQAEILDCLRHYADERRLREKIRFHCEVEGARFNTSSGEWQVHCTDGQTLRARALICATGQSSRPLLPRLPGLGRFQGPAFHLANWGTEVELAGRRIAAIGTGANAIQFIPWIAPQAQCLSLFQRSAPYVIAKPDRAYADWEHHLGTRQPWLQRLDRGLKYLHHKSRMLAFTTFPALMKVIWLSFRHHLHRQTTDPQLHARLVPDCSLDCKHILISSDYCPALARSNVKLIDTGTREAIKDAVVGRDGRRHEVDAIIFGTGFAATEFPAPMRILDLDRRDLQRAQADGAKTYKGISAGDFPSLFVLYGPSTDLGRNSIVYMLENQFPCMLGCLCQLQAQDLRYLDVKPEVQRCFDLEVQQGLRHTVQERDYDSWYKTAISKNTDNWPGHTFVYR